MILRVSRVEFWAPFGTENLTFLVKMWEFYVIRNCKIPIGIWKIPNMIYGFFSAEDLSGIGTLAAKPWNRC